MSSILIVESNQKLALFIQSSLRKNGYESDVAINGLDAIKSFAKGDYGLLIIDMQLSVLDGVTVCTKIRLSVKGKTIPIALSSSGAIAWKATISKPS